MKEKVLILASVASMIDQFNIPNIKLLQNIGYEVHVACNFEKGSSCSFEKIQILKELLKKLNVKYYQINFERNILKIGNNLKAYKEVKNILIENKYKFLHCHSPIGGVIGRIAGHRTQTKVIYTAHGFHFFKGAPLINWILYYPIEKYLSKYTDVLITINQEDYKRAQIFSAKKVKYIPGVGIDIEKIKNIKVNKKEKRAEFGLNEENIVLLSVGELNKNKNHSVVIKALAKINNPNIYYLICGQGNLKGELLNLAKKLNLEKNVKLLGFRKDIYEICKISDIFIFPSRREGLGLAALEGMCSGLPLISSNIHGIRNYTENERTGYCVNRFDVSGFEKAIKKLGFNRELRQKMGNYNRKIVKKFDIHKVNKIIKNIYNN
ncbi:glycosyltransferase family 4 protein [Fusobacterium ulcerans]|uniref:glycosyltransferase family 4 protein n=1 Tax=Fusobacterium ulcerans TaxID=861 RepID=UPI0034B162EA